MAKAFLVLCADAGTGVEGQLVNQFGTVLTNEPHLAIRAMRAILPGAASYDPIEASLLDETVKALGLVRDRARFL